MDGSKGDFLKDKNLLAKLSLESRVIDVHEAKNSGRNKIMTKAQSLFY